MIPHYLDASVAVKLFCKEEGSELIREHIITNSSAMCYMTEFAFYETLSVLKRKWAKGKLTDMGYRFAILQVGYFLDDGLIQIDSDFKPHETRLIHQLGEMVERHGIDYSDVLQIYTILNGKRRNYAFECKTVLVTEDRDLAKAATSEGLRVWRFPDQSPPIFDEVDGV